MKNKKALLALAAVVLLAAVMLGVWQANKTAATDGLKSITVEVCHSDQTTNTFEYETDAEFLGDFLLEEGLVAGDTSEFGLYVATVDGETADYSVNSSWWCLEVNGEASQTGADNVALQDGGTYTWTYTIS